MKSQHNVSALNNHKKYLQYFDAVGWMAGRAFGL